MLFDVPAATVDGGAVGTHRDEHGPAHLRWLAADRPALLQVMTLWR